MKQFFIVLALCITMPACFAQPKDSQGVITSVSDGDTVNIIDAKGSHFALRIMAIDAPEVTHGDKPGQPHGDASAAALEKILPRGTKIRCETISEDSYHRQLCRLKRSSDGFDYALKMVEGGHAHVYRRYFNEKAFIDAEAEAKEKGLGLWGYSMTAVEPEAWRRICWGNPESRPGWCFTIVKPINESDQPAHNTLEKMKNKFREKLVFLADLRSAIKSFVRF